jgi:hypothetical protein
MPNVAQYRMAVRAASRNTRLKQMWAAAPCRTLGTGLGLNDGNNQSDRKLHNLLRIINIFTSHIIRLGDEENNRKNNLIRKLKQVSKPR